MQLPLSRVGLAVALLLLGACADSPSGPKDDGELAARRGGPNGAPDESGTRDVFRSAGMLAAPSGTATVTPVNSQQDEVDSVEVYYEHPTRVVVRSSGTVTLLYNNLPGWGGLANTNLGTFYSAGWWNGYSAGNCSGNVTWGFIHDGVESNGRTICYPSDWTGGHSYTDTAIVQGRGYIKWNKGWRGVWQNFCNGTGQPPCFVAQGEQQMTLTVTPLPGDLNLGADSQRVAPGSDVSFTSWATPSNAPPTADNSTIRPSGNSLPTPAPWRR